jgi:hypothetical protein
MGTGKPAPAPPTGTPRASAPKPRPGQPVTMSAPVVEAPPTVEVIRGDKRANEIIK